MIGQTAARPSVWIREAAVEPQAWRFYRATGEDNYLRFFGNDLTSRSDAPCDAARDRLCVRVDSRCECIRQQGDRSASGRPAVARQGHGNVADRRGPLGLQVDRRTQWLETALRTVATKRTSLSTRKHQPVWIARSASVAARLQDRVLLRPERGARDVLGPFDRKAEILCALKEDLFLKTHRRGFNRQGVLDPFVIREEFAIAEWKQMIYVVRVSVCAFVVCKGTGSGSRGISLVMVSCSSDS